MRIWVTRAAPEAEATAERLRAIGHTPLVAPVLQVRPAEGPGPDLTGVGAIAFTSRNGVRAFAGLTPERGLPVFAVGHSTASAAAEAGFKVVHAAEGDAEALAALIGTRTDLFSGEVLHAGPEEPAGDLVGALKAAGIACRLHAVYRALPASLPLAATAALGARPVEIDAVLVHSQRAARCLAELTALERAADSLWLFCISPAAAEPLARLNFRKVTVAPFPNEASLLKLVSS